MVYIDKNSGPVDECPQLPNWQNPESVAGFLRALPNLNEYCISAEAELMRRMEIDFHVLGGKIMVCSMPVVGNRQTIGILHGGANAVLGETTGSVAANYLAEKDMVAVGSNIFITHHRPSRQGRIFCVAQLVHGGKKLCHYELKIYNESGKLTASGTHTCAFVPRTKP